MSDTPSRALLATAPVFTPAGDTGVNDIVDATFVTRAMPDISPNSGVIGLCTVPSERAGPDDLGWHITDFLAFKTLLRGHTHHKAQKWFAHCDIAGLVKANPEAYLHGKDGRVVGDAANSSTYIEGGQEKNRLDEIHVESSADKLIGEFFNAIEKKSKTVKQFDYTLVVIICGPTSLEQDVFFGDPSYGTRVTSLEMRSKMPEDGIKAMVITPALFSAGWQVNPSFCHQVPFPVRADRTYFLARQLGGIFARTIVEKVLGWDCPMLDPVLVEHYQYRKVHEIFPAPVKLSREQQEAQDALETNVHLILAARLIRGHDDHSFSFDPANDDWEKLIAPRQHKTLGMYREQWEKLESLNVAHDEAQKLRFLGNLFGGNKSSQVAHIKQLIGESFTAWPGEWKLAYGKVAKQDFEKFLDNADPEERDCHEMFNVMEQRSTSVVMADMLAKYLHLPMPLNQRCRDWDQPTSNRAASEAQHKSVDWIFDRLSTQVPWVYTPPGVNLNTQSKVQRQLHRDAHYLAMALVLKHSESTHRPTAEVREIEQIVKKVKQHQFRLLFENADLRERCSTWLLQIAMPICAPRTYDETPAQVDFSQIEPIINAAETFDKRDVQKEIKMTREHKRKVFKQMYNLEGDELHIVVQEFAQIQTLLSNLKREAAKSNTVVSPSATPSEPDTDQSETPLRSGNTKNATTPTPAGRTITSTLEDNAPRAVRASLGESKPTGIRAVPSVIPDTSKEKPATSAKDEQVVTSNGSSGAVKPKASEKPITPAKDNSVSIVGGHSRAMEPEKFDENTATTVNGGNKVGIPSSGKGVEVEEVAPGFRWW